MAKGVRRFVSKNRSRNRTENQAVTAAPIAPTKAWPRTWSPCEPSRSGSLSTPAAPMIGVASRKAKRAASSLESPARSATPHARPGARESRDQREGLGGADPDRVAEAQPAGEVLVVLDAPLVARWGAAPERLGAEQHQPVDEQEDRRGLCRGEEGPQRVLEQQAEEPRGDRPDHQQPAQLRVGVLGVDEAVAQRAAEALHDADPVPDEEQQQDEGGGAVGGDQEAQEVVVVLVDVPAEDAREHHAVAEARDREELGDALWPRLEIGKSSETPWSSPRTIAWK